MSTNDDLQVQCYEQIQSYRDSLVIKKGSESSSHFDSILLKAKAVQLATALSSDATKLALAFKPPCDPKDAIAVLEPFCATVSSLFECYKEIPFEVVQCYKEDYETHLDGCFNAAQNLLSTFITHAERQAELQWTANIWESCKLLHSVLPADNLAAAVATWQNALSLVEDVQREVKEDDAIHERVVKMVDISVLLLKLVGKQYLPLSKETDIEWLDSLCLATKQVPSALDDLVCEYEEDEDKASMQSLKAYHTEVLNLIKVIRERAQGNRLVLLEKCENKFNELQL